MSLEACILKYIHPTILLSYFHYQIIIASQHLTIKRLIFIFFCWRNVCKPSTICRCYSTEAMNCVLTIMEIIFKIFLDVLREMWHSDFNMSNKGFEMSAYTAKHPLAGVKEHWRAWRHLNHLWPTVGKKKPNKETETNK